MDTINTKSNTRLLSLDVMRGITIAGMIMVNNPGSWDAVYTPLEHAAWNGLTPTDLVFPFFMFIMGISCYASLRKFDFRPTRQVIYKILKRTALIFLVGLVLAWFGLSLSTYNQLKAENLPFFSHVWGAVTNFESVRILGVLQRLALCYGFASLIVVLVKHKYIPYIIIGGLVGYFFILVGGNGFEPNDTNILGIVDRSVFSLKHLYLDRGVEPEGLLSTIPSVCHVLIGFYCGRMLMETKDNKERMLNLFLAGTIMTFLGFLLSYGCPINKKIWSPTFVLVTCGLGSLLLALLIWIIDVKQYKSWSRFFQAFGVNPLAIYVFAGILASLIDFIVVNYKGDVFDLKSLCYEALAYCFNPYFASLAFALLFIGVCWTVAYVLYKKKIYIKL